MPEKPYRQKPDPAWALNALDLALESQKLEEELCVFVRACLPLLESTENLCRGLDRAAPELAVERAGALALLAVQADKLRAEIGLERIGEAGEIVDAIRHHVVEATPREDKAHGTVLQVTKYGWRFRGRIIQQASVVVSTKSVKSSEEGA